MDMRKSILAITVMFVLLGGSAAGRAQEVKSAGRGAAPEALRARTVASLA